MTVNQYLPEPAAIISILEETAIDWTFTLAYTKPVVDGQFLQVSLPGIGEAPISISAHDAHSVYLTIRAVGELTRAIFQKKAGENLFVRGPFGNGFDRAPFKDKDVIVIAGGTGLAPVRGFVRSFATNAHFARSVHVLVGFKSPQDVLFADEVAQWQKSFPVQITVDKGDGSWTGSTGLVTGYIVGIPTIKNADVKVVVVGPPLMMKFTIMGLIEQGIQPENITVSYERNMSCGVGKCGHCKIDSSYVCVDGPVFTFDTARHLID